MNFPVEQYPFLEGIYWFINTAGLGGIVVGIIAGGTLTAYLAAALWIRDGGFADETDEYTYPTPALHEEHEEEPPRRPFSRFHE